MSIPEVLYTYSEDETRLLARQMAEEAKAGDVFALVGDLGVGKTVFAKGFADGLGVFGYITSPTFTLIHEYETKKGCRLMHSDLYRLSDEDELYDIGWDEYLEGDFIVLAEWADMFPDCFPGNTTWIMIEKDLQKGVNARRITVRRAE